MKVFEKIKFIKNGKQIKKYKVCGITLLRKEKSPIKKKWNFLGIKMCKKNKNFINMQFNNTYNLRVILQSSEIKVYTKQREEFSKNDYQNKIEALKTKPVLSIVMPIYNADPIWLIAAIKSIKNQYYKNWELYAVDDGSVDRRCCAILQKMSEEDKRIIFYSAKKNQGISAASNKGISLSVNEYFLLMDQDDEIAPDALYWFAQKLNDFPDADVIYSDECKINTKGEVSDFYYKPDWSPALLLNHMYTSHFSLYRKSIVEKAGGFRSAYDFSQDYDLILRVSDITDKIYHIERVLYYWRTIPTSGAAGGKDYARQSNLAALSDWYTRQGLQHLYNCTLNTNYGKTVQKNNPLVSIIIPSDSLSNLIKCITAILQKTSYTDYEIIPVTNSQTAKDLKENFSYLNNLNICHYNKIFNFSDKCNEGAKFANGEYVIFYNDDVFPETPDWIERLMDAIYLKNVGAVSPLLRYENGLIQYAGMVTNVPGIIGTAFHAYNYSAENYAILNHNMIRNVSILSGACFLMRKDLFTKIGGFDAENTPNGHSDIDISFKIMEAGLFNVYAPNAKMVHIGNHTWHAKNKADKADIFLLKRWGKYLEHDPYFTDSMKTVFYQDFPWEFHIHSPENLFLPKTKESKDVLVVSHQLTRTGAPAVLLELVKVLIKNNYFPVVLSPEDGPLKKEFLDLGVTVIIDESFKRESPLFERFARNFDYVILNTLVCFNAVNLLKNSLPKVIWWLHEGTTVLDILKSQIPTELGDNISIYCVSEYSRKIINPFIKENMNLLPFGLEDINKKSTTQKTKALINFITVGTIEKRKGQDILLEAIKALPTKYKNKVHFTFVGSPEDKKIVKDIQDYASKVPFISLLENTEHKKLIDIYRHTDCIITPSRDEPMSIVSLEMMMMKNLCICSNKCGIADFLKDGVNGFIFHNENVDELTQKIVYIVDNFSKLDNIRAEGRKVYENHFTLNSFEKDFMSILKKAS